MHLSTRLVWHDRAWDGHICDHPSKNTYCMVQQHIRKVEMTTRKTMLLAGLSPVSKPGNRHAPETPLRSQRVATPSHTRTRSNSVSCLRCQKRYRHTRSALRRTVGCEKRAFGVSARMKSSTSGNRIRRTKSSAGFLNPTGRSNCFATSGESWRRTSRSCFLLQSRQPAR